MVKENLKINENDVFRLFDIKKRKHSIAKYALNNKIVPFPGFNSTTFNDKIWTVKKSEKYGNSYTLYLHSLRVTVELMLAYEATKEIEYFNKAEEIINSWIKHTETDDDNPMIWYDHTTANRTQALIQYIYLANQLERDIDENLWMNLLKKHSEIMSNDDIYKFNNHGLMMDRSLMILGYILDDESSILKGKSRAINTFWYSFSSQGIHLENSPQYHTMVVRMYNEIEAYLNKKDNSLGEHVVSYLKLAKEYIPLVTKPNQRLSSIGDSGSDKQPRTKQYKNIYDIEAGISILQYEYPSPFFVTFISGYSSRVHKHKDDLSITLNYKNKDFFVDPGKYSYTRNKTRTYITSQSAHSTFYLEDFNYNIHLENRYNRKIVFESYHDNQSFTLVKGRHGDYTGCSSELTRTVVQLKDYPILILLDNLDTDNENPLNLVQKFNLATAVDIDNIDNGYRLTSDGEEMVVKQYLDVDQSRIIKGDKNKPVAVNSAGFAKVKETQQLEFKRSTTNSNVFITSVYDDRVVENLDIQINDKKLQININDQTIDIYV
ncbi:heparinase II/III family protein [Jeotgalicoccus huakuii]|nr:heparinase II/III family protein [Jeotgalicoccus huakuii]